MGPLATRAGFSAGDRMPQVLSTPFSLNATPNSQFNGHAGDPFGGASLSLRPEELDRLDVTQIENGCIGGMVGGAPESHHYGPPSGEHQGSSRFDGEQQAFTEFDHRLSGHDDNILDESLALQLSKERFRMLENSIHGTINALNGDDPYYKATLEMMNPVLNTLPPSGRQSRHGENLRGENLHGAPFTPPPSGPEKVRVHTSSARPFSSSSNHTDMLVHNQDHSNSFRPASQENGYPSAHAPNYYGGHEMRPLGGHCVSRAPLHESTNQRTAGGAHPQTPANTSTAHGQGLSKAHQRSPQFPRGTPGEAVFDERGRRTEADHRRQLGALQQDLERMLQQHEQVIRLKNEVERGLQTQVETAGRQLAQERRAREADRERYTRVLREMRDRIRSLEATVGTLSARAPTTGPPGDAALADAKRQGDARIASLAKHFEREKAATVEVMKARFRAEVGLLVPRIKDRLQAAYRERIRSTETRMGELLRTEYDARIQRLQEEHAMEIKVMCRQMRQQVAQERADLAERFRQKYELRILDVRNECERRVLERIRHTKPSSSSLDDVDF